MKTVFCHDWSSFAKILYDRGGKQILDMLLLGDGNERDTMVVQYKTLIKEARDTPFQNPFLGSLVTAYAWRSLNEVLVQLGPRVLYW